VLRTLSQVGNEYKYMQYALLHSVHEGCVVVLYTMPIHHYESGHINPCQGRSVQLSQRVLFDRPGLDLRLS